MSSDVDKLSSERIQNLAAQARMSLTYVALMATAGVLAAVALLTNSIPVLIGAMAVAPVLPPIELIAFAFVGGRLRLAWRGVGVSLGGLACAILLSLTTTWFYNATGIIDATGNLVHKPLLEERARPGWYSVATALAAGIAGCLAVAESKVDTMVGVVASVALVPAAGAGAIALLSGEPHRAIGGFGMLLLNYLTIVGVGILVLSLIGYKPGPERRHG